MNSAGAIGKDADEGRSKAPPFVRRAGLLSALAVDKAHLADLPASSPRRKPTMPKLPEGWEERS
jgi:hypothetical protein